jgi:hypothetical protein
LGMFGLRSRKALILQTWVCLDWSQGSLKKSQKLNLSTWWPSFLV